MPCQVVNSQAQVQSRLPSLPQQLPQTQWDWNSVLSTLNQWGQILQQESHAPNVIPSQFQTFTTTASAAVLAALTASSVTPSIDSGTQYYGQASLKVVPGAGGTLTFSGYPISIAPASRWFCSFQINAPSGCTGTLTVKTSAHTISESFNISAAVGWQQVWGLFDLRAYADTQATWEFTFSTTATVWIDGMQMNAVGSPIGTLPKFAGTQMVTGGLAYQSNLDGVPNGSTYVRTVGTHVVNGVTFNYKGVWSSATTYVQGDEVVYGSTYWLCLTGNTNSAPPSANWQSVGSYSAFEGVWSSTTAYTAGAEVTYGGNFWVCVTANTNSAPTTSNANWQIAGPASLDNISDGHNYQRMTLLSTLTGDLPYNGDFEQFADGQTVPDGWSGADPTSRTSTAFSGTYALALGPNSAAGTSSRPFGVQPGMRYNLTEYAYCGAAGAGGLYLRVLWYSGDADNFAVGVGNPDYISFTDVYSNGGVSAAFTWQQVGVNCVAPSNARFARIVLYNTNATTSYFVDRVAFSPNTNQDYALDGSDYLRMPAPPGISCSGGCTLTQTGTGAQFTISSGTFYIGNITMSVNSGSISPGSYATWYVYFDSPNYVGGAVSYQITTAPADIAKNPWRFFVGQITTTPSGGGGGGGSGGSPCFSGDTRIRTADGLRRFDELPLRFEILNRTGRHRARLLRHPNSSEPMRCMGNHLVTEGHLIRVGESPERWVMAKEIFHEKASPALRTVYNLHVYSDDPRDHHYILENGLTAHNIKP